MDLQSLGDSIIEQLMLEGHLRLTTHMLALQVKPRKARAFFGGIATDLWRPVRRPHEDPQDYDRLYTQNSRVASLEELLQNFSEMYPQGLELAMLEVVMNMQQPNLYWKLYWKLYPERQPSLEDKQRIFEWSCWYKLSEVAMHYLRDPEMWPQLTKTDFIQWMNHHATLGRGRQPQLVLELYRLSRQIGLQVEVAPILEYLERNGRRQIANQLRELADDSASVVL